MCKVIAEKRRIDEERFIFLKKGTGCAQIQIAEIKILPKE
jgi:hypothetical protein